MRARRLLLTLVLVLGPAISWSQSEADLAALRSTLDQAIAESKGSRQSQSLVLFDDIIGRLENEKRQFSLSEDGTALLVSAYEHRARTQFSLGNTEEAKVSFRALITLEPSHRLDQTSTPPRLVDFFNELRAPLVGFISVQSVPQGAIVLLNGKVVAITDFSPVEVVAGDYEFEIFKNGYRPETQPVKVVAGETLSLQFAMIRTAATAFLITDPPDVQILIDGVSKGTTNGALDPALAAIAAARGLDPAHSSSRLEIPDIPSGSHTIEFKKPCYETVLMEFHIPEPQDYEIPPVRLEPSVGTLSITSEPPGGQIFIDGELQGGAPKTLGSVCAGVRRVEVRHASGRFLQDVDLRARAVVEIAAQIRPTLAYLGVVTDGPSAERHQASVESRLVRVASTMIQGMNFLKPDADLLEKALTAERLKLADLLPPSRPDPALLRRFLERLAASMEVQGFLVGRIPEEPISRSAVLYLFAAGSAVPDSATIAIDDASSYERFFEAFEKKASIRAPWSGLITVDTLLHEGPVAVRVIPGSPAEKAGLTRGDVVVAAGGRKIGTSEEFLAAVASSGASTPMAVTVVSAGGSRTLDIALEDAPREVSLSGMGALPNKISMDLLQIIEGYPGSENASFARLNLGLIALGLRDYPGAHEAFVTAKNELPSTPGLGRGTAAYYAGVTLEHTGNLKAALEEYAQAAQDEGATLRSPDGPRVQDIARRRIAALSGVR